MRAFRCECGQPLSLIVSGVPGTRLQVSQDAVMRQVEEAMARHAPSCPLAMLEASQAS